MQDHFCITLSFLLTIFLILFKIETMYATEKYVRFELKEIHQQVRELANDLGGDIRYLQQEIHDLGERIQLMEHNLEEIANDLKERNCT